MAKCPHRVLIFLGFLSLRHKWLLFQVSAFWFFELHALKRPVAEHLLLLWVSLTPCMIYTSIAPLLPL